MTAGHHDDEHACEVCHVFRVVHDGPFRFDDGEITEARFVTPVELAGLTATGPLRPAACA